MCLFQHFEDCYMKHELSRASLSKYVIHLLPHLSDGILECGPLVNASQYCVEGFIGWILDRCNARHVPGIVMSNNATFSDAHKVFFREKFHSRYSPVVELEDEGGFRLLGPHVDKDLGMSGQERIILRGLISSYLHRKFEILNLDIAKKISSCIAMCRFSSRVRFISDTD